MWPERDARQLAFQRIEPVVIDAGQLLDAAAVIETDKRALVHTASLHRIDRTVLAAGHDNRRLPGIGRLVIAGIGHFAREAEELPDRPLKQAFLFHGPHVLVLVKTERHPTGHAGLPVKIGERCFNVRYHKKEGRPTWRSGQWAHRASIAKQMVAIRNQCGLAAGVPEEDAAAGQLLHVGEVHQSRHDLAGVDRVKEQPLALGRPA